jgi:hypothetical protein
VAQHGARTRFRKLNQLRLTYKLNQQILNFKTRRIILRSKDMPLFTITKPSKNNKCNNLKITANDSAKLDTFYCLNLLEFILFIVFVEFE